MAPTESLVALVYQGPIDEIVTRRFDLTEHVIAHGDRFEVSTVEAFFFLQQEENWRLADKPAARVFETWKAEHDAEWAALTDPSPDVVDVVDDPPPPTPTPTRPSTPPRGDGAPATEITEVSK